MSEAQESNTHADAIAIVGMAVRLPGARDLEAFWSLLKEGREAIKFFTAEELIAAGCDPRQVREPGFIASRGYLDDVDQFDAGFFGISPREASLIDPQHRVMMEVAWHAMEHAGYDPEQWEGSCATFTSAGMNTYLPFNLFTNPGLVEQVGGFQLSIYNDKDFVPTRIAYALNAKGPAIDIGTACSSSLVGVHMACQQLLSFQSDLTLVGGITIHLPQETGEVHQPGSAYSPDGHCRPFDAAPSGLVDGNGAAAVVLKRLEDALADGDTIHGVIRGSAINNDGSDKVGYSAPSIDGQADVILEAQALAGVGADQISYVEAHGTATPLGDPIEVAGLTQAFRHTSDGRQFCGLGSVKSNIGHVDKAAGLAGLIKVVLGLQHEVMPPNLHFTAPNPRLDLENTPFFVVPQARAWPRRPGQPRIAAVSSFGVGGTNAHAILEEAPEAPAPVETDEPQLIVLSARSESALNVLAEELAGFVADTPYGLADIAHTLQVGRKRQGVRTALVCSDKGELADRLAAIAPRQCSLEEPPVAFLFSGQGSQHVGMGRALYQSQPLFREWLDRCAEILQPLLGHDLRELLYAEEASNERLRETEIAQPALFAVEYALAQLLMAWGVRPAAVLGHSLGEYVAACVAGLFSLEEALALVAERGRLMQSMPRGAMLAVAMTEEELREVLTALESPLDLAAVNAANQCVVSGPEQEIERLRSHLGERGTVVRELETSHAFHSQMMEPMIEAFVRRLEGVEWREPSIPILSNVTGAVAAPGELAQSAYWCDHLRKPVRFHQSLKTLEQLHGNGIWLEVGPGRTLTGMAGMIQRAAPASANIPTLPPAQSRVAADAFLLGGLGDLWAHGAKIDWAAFHGERERRRVPLPLYPFEHARYWIEPGSGRGERTAGVDDDHPTHWFYASDWCLQADGGAVEEGAKRVLITGSVDDAWRRELTACYAQMGHQVVEELADGEVPDVLLYLPAPAMAEGSTADAVQPLIDLTQNLLRQRSGGRKIRVVVAGDRILSLGDAEIEPPRAALLGILRTLPYEYAEIECLAVDLLPSGDERQRQRLVRRLAHETLHEALPIAVVLRSGARWVLRFSPQPVAQRAGPGVVSRDGAYLLLGGLSDIGLAVAEALIQAGATRLLLTHEGDTLDAVQEQIAATEAWRRSGIEITLAAVRADSAEAFDRLLVEHFGEGGTPLGIVDASDFHGEKPFGLIQTLERAELEGYWQRQRVRLQSISRACALLRPDFCMVMSSLAAQIGAAGQLPAAVQGLYLQAFAQAENHAGPTPWHVIFWDQWSESTPDTITPQRGRLALELLFGLEEPGNLLVATSPPQLRKPNQAKPAESGASGMQTGQHDRPELATAYRPPENAHQQQVMEVWQRFLGIAKVGLDDDFFALGGNSLLGAQLMSELNQACGVALDLTALFTTPTVRGLSQTIVDAQLADEDLDALSSELDRLESLSDEEAAELLEQLESAES
ncbi:type I polyketide synthase [Endothiovibrio diazotrophicus]